MSKDEFLFALRKHLNGIPESEIRDIISDYEEHFMFGKENERTEEDIVKSLGNPKTIAKQLKATYYIDKAQEEKSASNITRAVFASVALGLFNIIIVLGPFIGLIGVLIGLYAAAIGITISGIALFISSIWNISMGNTIHLGFLTTFSLGIGCTGLGILIGIGEYYLTLGIFKVVVKYLKVNLKIIKGE